MYKGDFLPFTFQVSSDEMSLRRQKEPCTTVKVSWEVKLDANSKSQVGLLKKISRLTEYIVKYYVRSFTFGIGV